MTQAIGRSRRHNQEKTVEVYELVTANTIEIDYREFRGRCTLQRRSPPSDDLVHDDSVQGPPSNDSIPIPPSEELVQVPLPAFSNAKGPFASSIAHATHFDV